MQFENILILIVLAVLGAQVQASVRLHVAQKLDEVFHGDIFHNDKHVCWIHKTVPTSEKKHFDCQALYKAYMYNSTKGIWMFKDGEWAVMPITDIGFLKNRGGEPVGMEWKLVSNCTSQ